MDELERRIIHLEHQAKFDRERLEYQLDAISRRLQTLETPPPIERGSVAKIALALFLPFLVLLMTGDIKAALRALAQTLAG